MKYKVVNSQYKDLVQNTKKYFITSSQSIWDKRNQIKVIQFNGTKLTIKSFKIPHIINKFAYTFLRDSKAKRSYINSIRISKFVPKAIGYIEYSKFGLFSNSYFISEKYDYDFTIREVLTQKTFNNKALILKQFASFTYELHKNNIKHLDYSPGNILIKINSDTQYEFKIIDLNRMEFVTLTKEERLKNFSKLWATDEDLTLIMKAYAEVSTIDEKEAVNIALRNSRKHKEKTSFKKRFKREKNVN